MAISHATAKALESGSWIRRMFEAGAELKQRVGAENVFDFSLGNPLLEPPPAFTAALRQLIDSPAKGRHRYMPNAGYPETRQAVAGQIRAEQQIEITAEDIVMTVGAAGAINVALHSLLNPGDEVIVIAPYFAEYLFYVEAHQGKPVVVNAASDFSLDVDAIGAAITAKTKAIIINTPNNPTGRVYTQQSLAKLSAVLRRKRDKADAIYLLFDTPYAHLVYDGISNPTLFCDHPDTLVAHSYSKELGLAGERIGYLAISPRCHAREALRSAAIFNNRVLGFVNAPATMQQLLPACLDASVDIAYYREIRDMLSDGLREAGYQFTVPEGAFYLFPRSPIADDVAFCEVLRQQNILAVPGRGFGWPGHLRLAFCVELDMVRRSIPRFAAAFDRATQSK